MAKISLIAPNQEIAEYAVQAKELYHWDFDICIELMEAAVQKALSLKNKGTKIIISRGGTALCLKKKSHLPVVEIKMTLGDAALALQKAQKYGNRFLFVGFSNHLQELDSLGPLMGLDIAQVVIQNYHEAEEVIAKAKEEGVHAIIGGAVQCEIARKLHIPAVFLHSGIQAIHNAYNEAKAMLDLLSNEERKTEELKTLLDNTGEGFVAIDKKNKITLVNQSALRMLNCKKKSVIGQTLTTALPLIANLSDSLQQENSAKDEIVIAEKKMFLYNKISLYDRGEIIGAIATLKDAQKLSEEERKIRLNQHNSGLYARYYFQDILGKSSSLKEAQRIAQNYAKVHSTVLITSESGTGKEMFTQSIHNASNRRQGPFVAINCAALASTILESELFGYVEGAFSGARKGGKAGVFELAHGGTIFLDEVGEITVSLQEKLLRVLQERSVMRLGDDKIIPVDVRIIAATNKDLVREVKEGRFRKDLFFRLNVLRLTIPPLRERKNDIVLLAEAFLKKYALAEPLLFSTAVETLLKQYSWPGNVRELENLMERLSITALFGKITENDLHEYFLEMEGLQEEGGKIANLDCVKVEQVLSQVQGNKTKAAKLLGIHRSTLWRLLNEKQ
ncbi:sigma 54-interacting transcriptional regulator [Pelosinus propionicus]|uniref:Transcriptional regulator containing PAS, AAA-type ATPase, and DNA-binding Fis domains n=1 Tax=Pelosinus propionicus DSM 13327 TaxID=1123291 RepID=A0A1I4K7K7_9FIRM|nr:sigma 54-interacting transcriptional regulator [Pelosinus propionicus]SFL74775.1 Transcriptional regulator containing PAS, AAA-type ATPase, and DNA-binding Fis domains [Pelosinus propionicus DSM 13327]